MRAEWLHRIAAELRGECLMSEHCNVAPNPRGISSIETRLTRFRQWRQEHVPRGKFWNIVVATALFNCGFSSFLFLYNFYLLDRGFTERPLGTLTTATILGTISGTIPVGILASRFGLRRLMIPCLLLVTLVFAAKVGLATYGPQLVLDFIGGVLFCGWMVCLSPLVAGVVESTRRPVAFSILYAVAMVGGSLGGLIGGHMPGWWQHTHAALTPLRGKQLTMLTGIAIATLATIPLSRVKISVKPAERSKLPRIPPNLRRFFAASACWSFAIGCLNPFTGIYLIRHFQMPLMHIGNLTSITQLLHALAVFAAPWVLRRFSLITNIVAIQTFAAVSLLLLITTHTWGQASVAIFGFLVAQHMCDPNLQALLMEGTSEHDRSGASAIYLLLNGLAQAIAATIGGTMLARFGYPPVLVGVAGAVLCAAMLFRSMDRVPEQKAKQSVAAESVGY
jgi:MFS family permease